MEESKGGRSRKTADYPARLGTRRYCSNKILKRIFHSNRYVNKQNRLLKLCYRHLYAAAQSPPVEDKNKESAVDGAIYRVLGEMGGDGHKMGITFSDPRIFG